MANRYLMDLPVCESKGGITVADLSRRERKKKETQRLAASSAEAQTVKYADIIDNCRGFAATGSDFAPVFLRECQHLLPHLNKGNAALYQLAKEVIEKELKELRK